MNHTDVIVLCGGLGTRLRAVVRDVPKVLAEINGRPFLRHLLERLRDQGVRDVYLSTGYLAEQIEAFAETWSNDELSVHCVPEDEPLGTGGAIRHVWASAGLETPLAVLNGDTFFTGALEHLLHCHEKTGAEATLAVVHVPSADRYGVVSFRPESPAITAFHEKGIAQGAAWINAGAYVLGRRLLDSIPAGRPVSLEREVFPGWVERGLFACPFPEARFLDIGTPDDYTRAQRILA